MSKRDQRPSRWSNCWYESSFQKNPDPSKVAILRTQKHPCYRGWNPVQWCFNLANQEIQLSLLKRKWLCVFIVNMFESFPTFHDDINLYTLIQLYIHLPYKWIQTYQPHFEWTWEYRNLVHTCADRKLTWQWKKHHLKDVFPIQRSDTFSPLPEFLTQRIHVWYIYLHLPNIPAPWVLWVSFLEGNPEISGQPPLDPQCQPAETLIFPSLLDEWPSQAEGMKRPETNSKAWPK